MQHTLSNIYEIFDNLNRVLDQSVRVRIVVNPKLKMTIAQAVLEYKGDYIGLIPKVLEVSKGLLQADISNEVFAKIIKHEYIHFLTSRGLQKEVSHHNRHFKNICEAIGTYSTEEIPYKVEGDLIKAINLISEEG